MLYLLNGGGREIRSLQSPEVAHWLQTQGIKKLLIIAFAMVETHWQQVWEQPEQILSFSGIAVASLTTTNYSEDLAIRHLATADAIFMPGGMPAVLMERLEQTGLADLLHASLKNNQIKIVGGASAGAMVLGKLYGSNHKPGLNVIGDHIIDVHFSSRGRMSRLQEVINADHSLTGVGIDEDTTLILNNAWQPQRIFGKGTVTYYRHNETMKIYDPSSSFSSNNSKAP